MIFQMIEDLVNIGLVTDESAEVTTILNAENLDEGFTGFAPPSWPER